MTTRVGSRTVANLAVLLFLANPSAADAAFTSTLTSIAGLPTATMTGDGASDDLSIDHAAGLFRHNRFAAGDPGFASALDFDTSIPGDQTLGVFNDIHVNAGGGDDTIVFFANALRGIVDGGPGSDTLNYSLLEGPVVVNLGFIHNSLDAVLGGDQVVPPTAHAATGTATITNYDLTSFASLDRFDIAGTVVGLLPADVTEMHLHRGPAGAIGSVLVDLTSVPRAPTGSGFTFAATGLTYGNQYQAAVLGGGAYVDIHTSSHFSGVIRGQLVPSGNVNLATGRASGTGGIRNIENVIGTGAGDSLVGNAEVNTFNGGGGPDWIVGGPGADVIAGDAGHDVLLWRDGHGNDVIEAGADDDTVQVNGSAADAAITVAANGARLAVARGGGDPFSLDIGAAETVIINGLGGHDSLTVGNLAGAASLSAVRVNGFDGNDTITYVPATSGALVLEANGGTGGDTLQGPNAASTWTVTAANLGAITGLVTSFRFVETLSGGNASDTFNVKAFTAGTSTVIGGGGADTLNYDAESRAHSGDTTPPDGVIDSPGVQSLGFTQVEAVTILNARPTIAMSDVTVTEGVAPNSAVFNVTLSNPSLLTVSVNFASADGTAVAPADFTSQSGTVTFVPGDILETIALPVIGDALQEPIETFVVNLSGPVNAVVGKAQGVATIVNNGPPTISGISDQAINENAATALLPFTISDVETAAASLTVSGSSSNLTLVPNANIAFSGSGAGRTVRVTPASSQFGSTIITVTVSDGTLTANETFVVTVNDQPSISAIANQTIAEDTATTALPFTLADGDSAVASLTVSGGSSNTALVLAANIVFGGSGADRTVTVTPAANQHGSAVITVTVSDGAATGNRTFTVTVTPVNDPPAITGIANLAIDPGHNAGPLLFIIDDLETAAAALTVSGLSSNPALVPNGNIAFAGAGSARTVTVTPASGQSGQSAITVTVNDGGLTAATTFVLTVNAPPGTPSPQPPPSNQPPAIAGLSNQTIEENATLAFTLTVGDDATPAADLAVSATSSNPALVPGSGLVLSGAGATRTLTVTPLLETRGDTTIAVTVSDGALTTTATATVSVTPVTPATPLLPPTTLTAQVVGSGVRLAWAAPATGGRPSFYVIEGGTAPGATTLPVISTPAADTSLTLTLGPGSYFFRVRSGNPAGTSAVSNEAAVTIASPLNVPGPPFGLQVSVVGTRVTFSWQRPIAGGEVDAWIIELETVPAGASAASAIDGMPASDSVNTFRLPPSVLSVSTDLPRGEYLVRVRGTNAAGPGPASNAPRFGVDLPGGGCDVLNPPVLLPPAIVGRIVTLEWRPPRAGAPNSYRLLVGSTPGAADLAVVVVGPITGFVFEAPPGTYHATVVGTNTCGGAAVSNSVPVVVRDPGAAPPPANVRGTVVGTTVTVAWDAAPNALSYVLEAGRAAGASDVAVLPLTATTVVVSNVPSGVYYVRVRAIGTGGASLPSAEVVVIVP